MRRKQRGPFDEREHGRQRGSDLDPSWKARPSGEQHRTHGHRDGEGRAGRGGPAARGRAQRGDVRTAIMLVLAEETMHGYQIMQTISDRTGGAWSPSPGAVYPTIGQLEDEGLVTTQEESGRRLVTLTSEGRTYLKERSARLGDP
jgi:hypothetical protein